MVLSEAENIPAVSVLKIGPYRLFDDPYPYDVTENTVPTPALVPDSAKSRSHGPPEDPPVMAQPNLYVDQSTPMRASNDNKPLQ